MSILLDALKKSEEQRQLGATPTISSPTPGSPGLGASEQQWLPLSMMVLSVVLMVWIGWQQYRQPDGILADSVGEPPQVVTRPVAPKSDGARESEEPARDSSARTPVESLAVREAAEAPEPASPGTEDRENELDRLNQSFSNFRAEEADEEGEAAPSAGVLPELPELPAESRTADSDAFEPAEPQPISFWELPQGVRDDLPEMRITVLVYAEEPEDRFLLIGGQRVAEGDSIGGGVTLEEIRREGAVFTFRKYRFLMKG